MGYPTSSYATAGIALKILEALKPPHPDLPIFVKVEMSLKGLLSEIFLRKTE